jgi:acetolactate synthase small subunit
MMQEKLKMMSNQMAKQIRDQAEHANEVDIETKTLKMELTRQKDEVKAKLQDLNKLEDANTEIKRARYIEEIDELEAKLRGIER